VPILDPLAGLIVHGDADQLGQGHGQRPAFPTHQDQHVVLALLLWGHANDLALIAGHLG